MSAASQSEVLIAGGGVAALETVLALRELSDGALEPTLISPEPEFTYRPLLVREPFDPEPADRISLEPALEELGAGFELAAIAAVDPERRAVALDDGRELGYGRLVVCTGARMSPAFDGVHTLWIEQTPKTIDRILSEVPDSGRLDLIVPPGVTWPLPLYEFALMTARRLAEGPDRGIRLAVITPEHSPLVIFGTAASDEIATLLENRGIEVFCDAWVAESDDGSLHVAGDGPTLDGVPVALPVMEGRAIPGLPADARGFLPIDEHCRVRGVESVYAAGDGTDFPIKQGGVATQQADAAASAIASELGYGAEAEPFRPVLRGRVLTGDESVSLRFDVHGGDGEGIVSSDYLWWPPHKVSGRYLAPWLAGESLHADPEPPARAVDVEVSVPREWHSQPLGFDPYRRP